MICPNLELPLTRMITYKSVIVCPLSTVRTYTINICLTSGALPASAMQSIRHGFVHLHYYISSLGWEISVCLSRPLLSRCFIPRVLIDPPALLAIHVLSFLYPCTLFGPYEIRSWPSESSQEQCCLPKKGMPAWSPLIGEMPPQLSQTKNYDQRVTDATSGSRSARAECHAPIASVLAKTAAIAFRIGQAVQKGRRINAIKSR